MSSNPSPAIPDDVNFTTWGIFRIAYGKTPSVAVLKRVTRLRRAWHNLRPVAMRLVKETYGSSPGALIVYLCSQGAISLFPAGSLCLLDGVLLEVTKAIEAGGLSGNGIRAVVAYLFSWFLLSMLAFVAERISQDVGLLLQARSNADYFPRLARALSGLTMDDREGHLRRTPLLCDSSLDFCKSPLWALLDEAVNSVKCLLEIAFLLVAISTVAVRHERLEVATVYGFALPPNFLNGAGYTFWAEDPDYQRLAALHQMLFDVKYSRSIFMNGISTAVVEEYTLIYERLRDTKADALYLALGRPSASWLWEMPCALLGRSSIVCLLLSSASYSEFAVQIMVAAVAIPVVEPANAVSLAVYVPYMLNFVMGALDRYAQLRRLSDILDEATMTYATLDTVHSPPPSIGLRTSHPHTEGVHIELRDVVATSSDGDPCTSRAISMNIKPGQAVVLNGSVDSKKDAMLDLITGLKPPTSGSIVFDGRILTDYGARQLQRSTVYLPRRDVVYPLSTRENILFGASPGSEGDVLAREAASLAGVSALLEQSKVLDVPPLIGQSMSFNGRRFASWIFTPRVQVRRL
uniref:ABC transporter domain-containing protein n=1 Tax=Schizophyllum commune (strain H4-8 / FGSC 9210) TaxID=578458 RepID=D8PTW1_SCHCM